MVQKTNIFLEPIHIFEYLCTRKASRAASPYMSKILWLWNADKRELLQNRFWNAHPKGTSNEDWYPCEVPITDNRVDEICRKYNYDFPKITARKINDYLLTGLLDTRDMMSISGHKSEATFEHYIKMKKSEHADRIAEKLNSTPNSLDMILGNMSPDDVRKLLKKVL